MQRDEERNLQSQFTKANMTQSCSFKDVLSLFPRLNGLKRRFLSEIHMIAPIQSDPEDISKDIFIIVKNDGKVYSFGFEIDENSCQENSSLTSEFKNWLTPIKPKLIENFCGKNIKTLIHRPLNGTFVLTNEGEVYSWGNKSHCFLGSEEYPADIPILVTNLNNENIVDIVCHSDHGLALTADGRVYKWGRDVEIQRDKYDEYNVFDYLNPPTQIEFELDTKIVCIACSSFCSMMVTNNGEVYSRGTLFQDRQYDFNPMYRITFSRSTDVIVKVACGLNHTLALTNQGDLYVWGCNQYGQLGNGNRTDVHDPLLLNTSKMGKLLDIEALNTHDISVAVNEHGYFYVWGRYTEFDFLIPHATFHTSMHDVFASERVMYKPLILSADDHNKYLNQLNMMRCMEDAFDDSSTSDFKVQVEGRDIHVHKVVLKICSSHFRTMFQHEWTENTKNVLKLGMFSYNVYKAYLKYLYTGVIDIPSEESLELLKLADMYGDMNLKTNCIPIIQRVVTIPNVLLVYTKAIEYNEKRLEEFCFWFALKDMTEVIQTESFMKLDENTKNMFLVKAAKAGIFKT